jgi:hypothetical protein
MASCPLTDHPIFQLCLGRATGLTDAQLAETIKDATDEYLYACEAVLDENTPETRAELKFSKFQLASYQLIKRQREVK